MRIRTTELIDLIRRGANTLELASEFHDYCKGKSILYSNKQGNHIWEEHFCENWSIMANVWQDEEDLIFKKLVQEVSAYNDKMF